jgi:hypothetical protein
MMGEEGRTRILKIRNNKKSEAENYTRELVTI